MGTYWLLSYQGKNKMAYTCGYIDDAIFHAVNGWLDGEADVVEVDEAFNAVLQDKLDNFTDMTSKKLFAINICEYLGWYELHYAHAQEEIVDMFWDFVAESEFRLTK